MTESPTSIVLRVQLLSGFRVWLGEVEIAPAWRPKAAALVKLLALSPQYRLHREEVLEHLWPRLKRRTTVRLRDIAAGRNPTPCWEG